MRFSVTIAGEPVGQGRPRFSTFGGRNVAIDPKKSRNWKAYTTGCMLAEKGGGPILFPKGVPVKVTIEAVFTRPASSYSTKNPKGREPKATRPDIENVEKALLDAATTAGIWHDDSQVFKMDSVKWIGAQDESPYLRFTVEAL